MTGTFKNWIILVITVFISIVWYYILLSTPTGYNHCSRSPCITEYCWRSDREDVTLALVNKILSACYIVGTDITIAE